MRCSHQIILFFAAVSSGCRADSETERNTPQQSDANVAPAPQYIALKDVKDLPVKWRDVARKWNGTINSRAFEPTKSALEQAKEIELFSLHPYQPAQLGAEKQNWIFYQRRSLGDVRIADRETIQLLLAAFNEGLGDIDGEEPVPSECYDPRHRIRVEHEGQTYDFDICFSCGIVAVYIDGKHADKYNFDTWEIAQPVFDAYLAAAGIPIAPKFITEGEDILRL